MMQIRRRARKQMELICKKTLCVFVKAIFQNGKAMQREMVESLRLIQEAVIFLQISGQWTAEEDRELAELFLKIGKKWSVIARSLKVQRTEHMVKNRFKTIMTRQKKAFPHLKHDKKFLQSFLNPEEIKYRRQEQLVNDRIKVQQIQEINEIEEVQDERYVFANDKNEVPQTSLGFEIYSPWVFSLTPTYTPNRIYINGVIKPTIENPPLTFSIFDDIQRGFFFNAGDNNIQ